MDRIIYSVPKTRPFSQQLLRNEFLSMKLNTWDNIIIRSHLGYWDSIDRRCRDQVLANIFFDCPNHLVFVKDLGARQSQGKGLWSARFRDMLWKK